MRILVLGAERSLSRLPHATCGGSPEHDGHRLIVRRAGPLMRLFTRRGHDWTDRYPAIVAAAAKLRAKSVRPPPYLSGRPRDWIKVKNPDNPARCGLSLRPRSPSTTAPPAIVGGEIYRAVPSQI
jgi:ATP-dependent DNA ligase